MRTPGRWGRRRAGRLLSAVGAIVVSALLLGILGFGYGTIPALGPALDPGRGAWTSAYGGTPVTSQTLSVPGLAKPAGVSFTGVLTQELDYTTAPLDYAILERSLGPANTMNWFPVLPANTWTPYDTGPYVKAPLTQVAADVASSAPAGQAASLTTAMSAAKAEATVRSGNSEAVAEAAAQLLGQLSQLPAGQIHEYPDSNAWAVNGAAVSGGGAILGGDPHLPQTLPSVWYEVALSAPGYQAAGATVPGVPGVLLGHNAHIAWSLTNTQNQATLYYAEQVRGDEYYWRGAWRKMTVVHYTIPVRGGATVRLTVDITVHGPIMTQAGQRMAVDWMGNVPSDDMTALLGVNQASDWTQFKAALAGWRAPTQNFTYADNDPVTGQSSGQTGNIGVYAAGYYPQVPSGCQPWLPMPGTGQCDISGVVPDNAIPQVYDPPSHVVATDNQRPVAADYPYYVGTSDDFYDPGYRAAHAYATLGPARTLSAASIASLQNNLTDPLAAQIVPKLLAALGSADLNSSERSVVSSLSSWNYSMGADSTAATAWWTFWKDYVAEVFEPCLTALGFGEAAPRVRDELLAGDRVPVVERQRGGVRPQPGRVLKQLVGAVRVVRVDHARVGHEVRSRVRPPLLDRPVPERPVEQLLDLPYAVDADVDVLVEAALEPLAHRRLLGGDGLVRACLHQRPKPGVGGAPVGRDVHDVLEHAVSGMIGKTTKFSVTAQSCTIRTGANRPWKPGSSGNRTVIAHTLRQIPLSVTPAIRGKQVRPRRFSARNLVR